MGGLKKLPWSLTPVIPVYHAFAVDTIGLAWLTSWTLGRFTCVKGILFILSLVAFISATGCESTTDPIAGWKAVTPIGVKVSEMSAAIDPIPSYKAISDDLQTYVNTKLPVDHLPDYCGGGTRRWCYWMSDTTLFEDGSGQHAVKFKVYRVNHDEVFVLIYDKSNVRIKTMRFRSGSYAS